MNLFNNLVKGPFRAVQQFVTYGQGNNALATIKQVNDVIEFANIISQSAGANSRLYFQVADGGGLPTFSVNQVSGLTCSNCTACCATSPCNPSCGGCPGINTSTEYACTGLNWPSTNRVSPGKFEVVIAGTLGTTYVNTVLMVHNPSTSHPGVIISVTKTGLNSWQIWSYDTVTGAFINAIDKAIIEVVLMK